MWKWVALSGLILVSPQLLGLDLENAKRINATCAFCHGIYGQGTPGTNSPRLAGLSAQYLAKEMKLYRSGERIYPAMNVTSQINAMSDKDIKDISEYLAGINLKNLNLPRIPDYPEGDSEAGRKVFLKECKGCHRRTGLGRMKKGIPPLAGQYGSYLFTQMKKFRDRQRYHDDDPEDETFKDLSEDEMHDLVAFVTDLPVYPIDSVVVIAEAEFDNVEPEAVAERLVEVDTDKSLHGEAIEEHQTIVLGSPVSDDLHRPVLIRTAVAGAGKFAGDFRITSTGEIILMPHDADLRSIAGYRGSFDMTPDGLIFNISQ